MPRPVSFFVVLCVCACVSNATAQEARQARRFEKQAVVAVERHAVEAGAAVLRQGGNAIDAAVATALALAVTHPEAGNLGGGGFIVAYLADQTRVTTIDFREKAPAAATPTMYLDAAGRPLDRHRMGPRAAGVPGTMRGLALAHQKYGKLPWRDLVIPAVKLAREGFPVSEFLARSLNEQVRTPGEGDEPGNRLAAFPESVKAFSKADGTPWVAGDQLVQPDLAATLERIAEQGPDEFYVGKTAQLIADDMASRNGLITLDDLKAYQAIERPAIHFTYRGHDIYGMGPPSSGGVVLGQMLGILERFDLKSEPRDSARTVHLVAEAQRRAFLTRATELADPDFHPVDVDRLLAPATLDRLASTINDRATPSASLAPMPLAESLESTETTHLSTIDAEGNAVALTYTLEQSFGSKAMARDAGFLLNNEMGDFNIIPGHTDRDGYIGTKPNQIQPGKRMLSSQTPTLVLRDGKVRVVTGSPGGRTIPNTVLWVVLGILEFGMPAQAAVDAPRTHQAWLPDTLTLEGAAWPLATRRELESRGHKLRSVRTQGDAHTIVVDLETGARLAAPDPRRSTSHAAGD